MADIVKQVAALMPGPGATSQSFWKRGLKVVFPFYHSVSDRLLPHMQHLYTIRNLKQFKNDLDYLLSVFEPLSMDEYLKGQQALTGSKPAMVLSFDDGLIQCYEEILPVLKDKGVPAIFFLNNAFIDNLGMFFRFKVSLLLERMAEVTPAQKSRAADLLHCTVSELRKRLLTVSYVEREITDQVAEVWEYSFEDYMRKEPVYLSSMHIRKMLEEGFEIGSHGIDHPLFSLLKSDHTVTHIRESMEDLEERYQLSYRYFAFPFTDYGVQDKTIAKLFKSDIIDAGFGTSGLKDDQWPAYYQRVPMEMMGMDARKVLRGELNRRAIRKITGRNRVDRGKPGNE